MTSERLSLGFKAACSVIAAGIIWFSPPPPLYWGIIYSIIFIYLKKKNRTIFIVSAMLLLIPVFAGVMRFVMPNQIMDIIDADLNVADLILRKEPHLSRYLIAYPAIHIYEYGGQNEHAAYTMLCVAFLSMTVVGAHGIFMTLKGQSSFVRAMFALALFAGVATQMNGRLIPAYLGIVLMIHVFTKFIFKMNSPPMRDAVLGADTIAAIFISFFLTTVSSGTMMVSFALAAVMLIFILCSKNAPTFSLFSATLLFCAGPPIMYYIAVMVYHNVAFFSHNLYGLLAHGLPRFIRFSASNSALFLIGSPLAVITLCTSVYFVFLRCPPLLPALLTVPIALLGGLFGISTATMMVPAVIILIVVSLPSVTLRKLRDDIS